MDKIKKYLSNKKISAGVVLFVIVLVAFSLRVYKFNDWLFFKGDQVRDAILVSHAYNEGPLALPLLGPRAGGTMLRLGPAFYYFQYLSTLFAHSTDPGVFAYPTMLFSLLAVVLTYFFANKFFSSAWSLAVTGLVSVAFALIEFSRFAWNPNASTLFVLLCAYAFLEVASSKNSPRKKMWWTAVAAASFSIASQFHFSVFFGLPFVLFLFLLAKRKQFREIVTWQRAMVFISIVVLFYVPVILSDVMSSGDNLSHLLSSVKSKSSSHTLADNVLKDAYYFAKYFLRLLFGYMGANKLLYYPVWIFIAAAGYAMQHFFRKETDEEKRDFIRMIAALFFGFFILYVPLAYKVDNPRFFLPVFMLPFIMLAFIGLYLQETINQRLVRNTLIALMVAGTAFANIYMTSHWFYELNASQSGAIDSKQTVVMRAKGDKFWWNGSHFRKIAEFMRADCEKGELTFLMPKSAIEYGDAIGYEMENSGEKRPIHNPANKVELSSDSCFYYVSPLRSLDKVNVEGANAADFITADLGNVFITRIDRKNPGKYPQTSVDSGSVGNESVSGDAATAGSSPSGRLVWKDVFEYFRK
jgi:hypothetical protein